MNTPVLSIVIRACNNRPFLVPLIESIRQHGTRHAHEIILVDNASTDGSADEIQSRFPEVVLIRNPWNMGPVRASNIGLRRALGEIILILDADTEILSGLDDMIAFLLDNPSCAAATGRVVNSDGSPQPNCTRPPTLTHAFFISLIHLGLGRWVGRVPAVRAYYGLDMDMDQVREVTNIGLCCFFIRASAFRIIGEQDEGFFMYFEDTDWCFRLAAAGLKMLYFPGLTVRHHGGRTTSAMPLEMNRAYHRSLKRFCEKHIFPRHSPLYNLVVKVLIVFRSILVGWVIRLGYRKVGGGGCRIREQPGRIGST